jgi:hypothetical protein
MIYRTLDDVSRHELADRTVCMKAAVYSAIASGFGEEKNYLQEFLEEFTRRDEPREIAVPTGDIPGLKTITPQPSGVEDWEEF